MNPIYGSFEKNILTGILGTKNEGKHVSLFFVRTGYRRKGIGKKLFQFVLHNNLLDEITVNSSTYAIPFYQDLGFKKTDEIQEKHGLKYTPYVI